MAEHHSDPTSECMACDFASLEPITTRPDACFISGYVVAHRATEADRLVFMRQLCTRHATEMTIVMAQLARLDALAERAFEDDAS